jgi:hypothetical protein
MRRIMAATLRNSAGVVPRISRATMEDDACPSRQAFTVWPKPEMLPSARFTSTVMVDPPS